MDMVVSAFYYSSVVAAFLMPIAAMIFFISFLAVCFGKWLDAQKRDELSPHEGATEFEQ